MRNVSMAIPACLPPYFLFLKISVPSRFYELRVQLFVAPDAVVHDHLRVQLDGLHRLVFGTHREYRRVPDSIDSFHDVLAHYIILRHMALVAGGPLAVRAMHPRRVIGSHHVAIHASGRVVREIAIRPRREKSVNKEAHERARDDNGRIFPTPARPYLVPYLL